MSLFFYLTEVTELTNNKKNNTLLLSVHGRIGRLRMVDDGWWRPRVPHAGVAFGQIGRFHGVFRADPVVLAREARQSIRQY
jgi:hypothetical protein